MFYILFYLKYGTFARATSGCNVKHTGKDARVVEEARLESV